MEFPCIDKVDKHLPRLLLLFIFVLFCKRLAVVRRSCLCTIPSSRGGFCTFTNASLAIYPVLVFVSSLRPTGETGQVSS